MGYKSLWTQCEHGEFGNMISYTIQKKKKAEKLKTLQTYFTHLQSEKRDVLLTIQDM